MTIILADPFSLGATDFYHNASDAQYGASASIDITSGPTLTAHGTMQGNGEAQSSLNYAFDVAGPAGLSSVPIDITYSYDVNSVGTSLYYSSAYLGINRTQILLAQPQLGEIDATDQVYASTLSLGTSYSISMSATAFGAGSFAFIDPTIAVDPAYLASNGYTASQFTINQSAGVEDGPAPVPEPASLALLGIGLVGMAASRFRRDMPSPNPKG